nr:uncharacterized protein LOC109177626 isoform X3 [Ipomoea batatas]
MCSRRSPTTSLVIHLRRRKTLRYNGSSDQLDDYSDSQWEGKDLVVSHKLKDLFVSSPPSPDEKSSGLWLQKVVDKRKAWEGEQWAGPINDQES